MKFTNTTPRLVDSSAHKQLHTVSIDDLMRGQREIAIVFCNQTYRLRITRNDKLILTK